MRSAAASRKTITVAAEDMREALVAAESCVRVRTPRFESGLRGAFRRSLDWVSRLTGGGALLRGFVVRVFA